MKKILQGTAHLAAQAVMPAARADADSVLTKRVRMELLMKWSIDIHTGRPVASWRRVWSPSALAATACRTGGRVEVVCNAVDAAAEVFVD